MKNKSQSPNLDYRTFSILCACISATSFLLILNTAEWHGVFHFVPSLLAAAIFGILGSLALIKEFPHHSQTLAPLALLITPILLFYGCYLIYGANYPYCDDYHAILGFLLSFLEKKSWIEKFNAILSQHNDHRIIFVRMVPLIQYWLFGKLNFKILLFFGNLSFLAIFWLLSKGFHPKQDRILFLTPAALLLFNFRPYEGILWPMVSLSGFWVIPMCLATLYCLQKPSQKKYFALALLFGALSTLTQGNGKAVLLIGMGMLFLFHPFKRLAFWTLFSGGLIAFDIFYHKTFRGYGHHPSEFATYWRSAFIFLGSFFPRASGLPIGAAMVSLGISETFPTHLPRSIYGATKLASELFVQEYADTFGLRAVINRCGVIAGPGQFGRVDQGVFTLWVAHHFFGMPLRYTGFGGMGKQVRDLLHPRDLFDLVQLQMDHLQSGSAEIYNIGGGVKFSVSLLEFTELCQSATGRKVEIASDPQTAAVDIPFYVSDCTKARNQLNWHPKLSPKDIVEQTYQWLSNNTGSLAHLFTHPFTRPC